MKAININQLDLFGAVQSAYANSCGPLPQKELYKSVAETIGVDPKNYVAEVGKQKNVNLFYRKIRWVQQSLKQSKLLERVEDGMWQLIGKAKEQLHQITANKSILAMSTDLGIIICSKSENVFDEGVIEGEVDLVLTSPPYVLNKARAYGGVDSKEWVSFIMGIINRIIPRLSDGASIALNIGQDSFIQGMPARHTHIERLTIAMEDAGLYLVDRLIWGSNKAPGPYAWVSLNRQQLNVGYEFVLWFSNNPLKLRSSNQRVLTPFSESHKKFVKSGGSRSAGVSSDGAYRKSVGDYSKTDIENGGRIPTNYLYFANKCKYNEQVNRYAKERLHCPTHGAKFPLALINFLVNFLSRPGDTVLDPFAGTSTVGQSCQMLGRNFIMIEPILEYVQQSFIRFSSLTKDFWINPALITPDEHTFLMAA